MPTTYGAKQLQGVLGFSTSTEIAQQNDSVIIKTTDELGKEIASFNITKSALADMFNIFATEKPLLKEIEDKFRNEFDYYVNRWKDFRIQDMNRDMIKYFYSINQENWPRLLSKRFELLESEFNNHCNGNLYASPYCLYGIVLHYEAYEELSEISEPLTRDP